MPPPAREQVQETRACSCPSCEDPAGGPGDKGLSCPSQRGPHMEHSGGQLSSGQGVFPGHVRLCLPVTVVAHIPLQHLGVGWFCALLGAQGLRWEPGLWPVQASRRLPECEVCEVRSVPSCWQVQTTPPLKGGPGRGTRCFWDLKVVSLTGHPGHSFLSSSSGLLVGSLKVPGPKR